MATNPSFTSTPRIGSVNIATANTARDGTGTITSLLTGVAAGTKVFEVTVSPTVTTTAGMVRLFISQDSGTTWRLFDEISISAATASASVKVARNTTVYTNLILTGTTSVLGASTHNAESINVYAFAGDLT
jgi:uncharacterized protein YigE (DUF2233 family)